MPIRVSCPGCDATFQAPESAVGRQAVCPKCKAPIKVTAAPPPAADPKANAPATPPRPAKACKAKPKRLTAETINAGIAGPIDPVRPTLLYRLGILLSLVTMLLMPLVYLGVIAAACYAVYYHAASNTFIFESARGRGAIYAFLLYVAPIIAGPIIILFMIKPLFARPASHQKTRSLRRESEPVLFAFVDKICDTVGSPTPRRIDIDCQVNASASFRKGIGSMLGNDLVLTIGMPLAAGLTVRQLGGVLAHEFGHFTQGAGMRLTYLVRSITHWFVRVVYERDEWDEWLHSAAASVDLRIGFVLWLAIFSVWITRKILWVLLHLGMAVAGFTLRQMEYDADRYEARFAGSKAFAETSRRLQELNAGMQMAYNQLGTSHREGRLVDDLPTLTTRNAARLPKPLAAAIAEAAKVGSTGWFDTHPCDKDRIASADAEQAPGVVAIDAPATQLFSDFAAQSKATTWEFYRETLGDGVQRSALEPIGELEKVEQEAEASSKRLQAYALGTIRARRALPWTTGFLKKPDAPKQTAERLRAARQQFEATAEQGREIVKRIDEAEGERSQALSLQALQQAGYRIDKKSFAANLRSVAGCKEVVDAKRHAIGASSNQLQPGDQLLADRIVAALELLQVDKVAARFPDGAQARKRAEELLPVVVAIDGQMDTINRLVDSEVMLGAIVQQLNGQPDEQTISTIDKIVSRTHPSMTQVKEVLSNQPYPFGKRNAGEQSGEARSVGAYVLPTAPARDALGDVINALPEMTDRLLTTRGRVLGELATIAEKVEGVLGLPPLEEPPQPEETGVGEPHE